MRVQEGEDGSLGGFRASNSWPHETFALIVPKDPDLVDLGQLEAVGGCREKVTGFMTSVGLEAPSKLKYLASLKAIKVQYSWQYQQALIYLHQAEQTYVRMSMRVH